MGTQKSHEITQAIASERCCSDYLSHGVEVASGRGISMSEDQASLNAPFANDPAGVFAQLETALRRLLAEHIDFDEAPRRRWGAEGAR